MVSIAWTGRGEFGHQGNRDRRKSPIASAEQDNKSHFRQVPNFVCLRKPGAKVAPRGSIWAACAGAPFVGLAGPLLYNESPSSVKESSQQNQQLQDRGDPLKIATFNINNINKRLDNLLAWLAKTEPDVVSLQELKAEQQAFPAKVLRAIGYEAVWLGERSWNGVAILARNHVPVLTRTSLPGNHNLNDHQARYIEAAVQGVLVTSIYLPNGNPQPGPKFNYKLAWFERLIAHAAELMASGAPVVLAGDYNVVPTPQDIYPTRPLDGNALIQPESRQAFARLLAQGWTDALRKLHPDGPLWTFWDYKFDRWQKDKGMRLDHFLLSPNLSERLVDGGVDRWVRGQENASDHAPAWIVLDL
jgi:exodeoxyribonuclease III